MLRRLLDADAALTAANGVAYIAAAGALDSVLGLSTATLVAVGGFLVAFAAGVAYVAARDERALAGAPVVVAANLAWAVASVAVAATDTFTPTTAGTVWIVLQALTVGALGASQEWARREARLHAASA